MQTFMEPEIKVDELAHAVIGAAIEAHRHLGLNLLAIRLTSRSGSRSGSSAESRGLDSFEKCGFLPKAATLGLLINFNVPILKNGVQRVIFTSNNKSASWRSARLGG